MQDNGENSAEQVVAYFQQKRAQCLEQGIPRWNMVFDIGLGFNKSAENNLALVKDYSLIQSSLQGMPSLIGFSNKSSWGRLFGGDQETAN